MTDESPYYVWRRDDGYVGCSRYQPPRRCQVLLVATEWAEARDLLAAERDTPRHASIVASWDRLNSRSSTLSDDQNATDKG